MSIAYFPMYGSYEEIFETLTDAQIGALVRGSLHYFNSGERGTMTRPGLTPLYTMLCRDIDLSAEAYEEKCSKRRDAARKRWKNQPEETSDPACMPVDADAIDLHMFISTGNTVPTVMPDSLKLSTRTHTGCPCISAPMRC